ncbi:hypothetical protein P153DRAFT_364729 [Dothidotthia symphoricarpi CBS 119687]|uniref:Uncharacterized protein n=1 Tax=Dothidotthia symphoricarpi CBS 119687 TaxID=1392245 RepID=A0A6A6AK30_9PLEO|nr:uncharacterized protein P153DRAFT_364729 [Dothidotthia symphoricarpi CBS 119687]KAF2132309.1 hypothetical protein P153DRAFT_364729 [Dothidotthia symphoricarpi CBS 119687]
MCTVAAFKVIPDSSPERLVAPPPYFFSKESPFVVIAISCGADLTGLSRSGQIPVRSSVHQGNSSAVS